MPSKKRKPNFQRSISVDAAGRLRLSGRFASKRQIASWKSQRKRRGLSIDVPKGPSKNEAARRRSYISKKSASTRNASNHGVVFAGEKRFENVGFRNQYYNLSSYSPDAIQAAIDDVRIRNPNATDIFGYPVVEGLDSDNLNFGGGTEKGFYVDVLKPDSADEISNLFFSVIQRYAFRRVQNLTLVFTFPIGQ